ncbi:MAG: hypothetical protein FWD44_03475 [Oscillospiraceae bacterium]|nr:hypothetical protein [Oscillospiraceae bacterium]
MKMLNTAKKSSSGVLCAVLCAAFLFIASCGNNEDKPAVDNVPEGHGITLEFVKYTPDEISLIINNGSAFDIRYDNGYSINGRLWGEMGTSGNRTFDLPSGETCEIILEPTGLDGFSLTPGEYQLTMQIIIDPDNTASAPLANISVKTYLLHVDFALENTKIPPDMTGVSIEVDFATPIGVLLNITNGTNYGRVYFDKSYKVQQKELADYVGADWKEIPKITSSAFSSDLDDNKDSIAPRQTYEMYLIYWQWLYGELEPGEYRIEMNIYHDDGEGNIAANVIYAYFTLDGEPIPDTIKRMDSDFYHPLSGISTFRAEVMNLIDQNYREVSADNTGLLVKSMQPFWGNDTNGSLLYVLNSHSNTVLDLNGKQIHFSDIPIGAIIDITFSGIILTSNPAIIGANLLIRIIE